MVCHNEFALTYSSVDSSIDFVLEEAVFEPFSIPAGADVVFFKRFLFGKSVFEQVIEDSALFMAEVAAVSFHTHLRTPLNFISHNPVRDGLRHIGT
jgi:hypothetical protein